jgi:genome maintenance exonuclease 1
MITPIDTPTGRHYPTPSGLLASVTTVIKATRNKEDCDRLIKWQNKLDKKHGLGTAETERDSAADRGDIIHDAIAVSLFDLYDPMTLITPELKPHWEAVQPILRAIKNPQVYEHIVYHESLKYAGTLDLICDWGGKKTIVDWKTTRRVKKEKWMSEAQMQVAAYKGAYEAMNDIDVLQSLIVVISPGRVQQFLYDSVESQSHWEAWLKKLEEYYS